MRRSKQPLGTPAVVDEEAGDLGEKVPGSAWWELGTANAAFWRTTQPPVAPGNGGLGGVEWLNVDTGARLLVWSDGSWKQGGVTRLHYLGPGSLVPIDLTDQVLGRDTGYDQGDPNQWMEKQKDAVECVRGHLGGPLQFT